MKSPRRIEKEYLELLSDSKTAAEMDSHLDIATMMALVNHYNKHHFSLQRKHNVYEDILSFVNKQQAQELADNLPHFGEDASLHLKSPLLAIAEGSENVQASEPIRTSRELSKRLSQCESAEELIELTRCSPSSLLADNLTALVGAINENNASQLLDQIDQIPDALKTTLSAKAEGIVQQRQSTEQAENYQPKTRSVPPALSIHLKAANQLYQRAVDDYKSTIRGFAHKSGIELGPQLETDIRAKLKSLPVDDPTRQQINVMHKAVMKARESHNTLSEIKNSGDVDPKHVQELCKEIKSMSSKVHESKLLLEKENRAEPPKPGRSLSE